MERTFEKQEEQRIMWTRFADMHSGGKIKIAPFEVILIEAPETEARSIFEREFHRDPDHVTCNCCGEDYSISEWQTVEEATEYDRTSRRLTLAEYVALGEVLVLRKTQ